MMNALVGANSCLSPRFGISVCGVNECLLASKHFNLPPQADLVVQSKSIEK